MTSVETDLVAVRELKRAAGTPDLALAARRAVLPLLERAAALGPLRLPVDLNLVASLAQVREIAEVEGLGVAGLVRPHPASDSALLIETRASDRYERKRFTVAHEIAHSRMPGFWDNPSRSRSDRVTGQFPDRLPLEAACDIAASEILLPESIVAPWLAGKRYDATTLSDLAMEAEASLSACGRRLVDLSAEPLAFVTFSERLSKTEQRAAEQLALQPALPGFETASLPEPKYRIDESCSRHGFPFLPRHKSAESDIFARARGDGYAVDGEVVIEIDGRDRAFPASVLFAPMRVDGDLRDRFLALLHLLQSRP
jgi:hypothetical protein